MAGAPTPPFLPQPFANDADPAYINTIPDTSGDPQRATWEDGFPPQTMTPIIAGGKPMLGPDMNGVLNALSQHIFAQQAGQFYAFSSDEATAIGGYKKGAIVAMADGTGLWQNNVDGNITDPDGGSASGWVVLFRYGYTSIASTGGTYTLSAAEASRSVIVIGGALVANLQVTFPTTLRSWLIVNNTSGAFTVTVQSGGVGVAIPQGGYAAPVEVYGNGAGLFPTVAPLSIPSAVEPTPSTYVVRSNSGDVYAVFFYMTGAADNNPMTGLFYETNNDGRILKISPANFQSKLSLSGFIGQVTAGQVPAGAVTQYAAAILANAALTGAPTAPTPAAGDNSTSIATTAFVQGYIPPYRIAAGRVTTGGVLQGGSTGISSVTKQSMGVFDIDVTAAGFTQAPTPVASLTIPGSNADTVTVQMISVTVARVRTVFQNSPIDRDFSIIFAGR